MSLSPGDFQRVAARLSLAVESFDIEQNGLGFNNLIYMAVGYGLLDFVDELRMILLHSPIDIVMPKKLDVTEDDIDRVHGLAGLRHASAGGTMSAIVTPQTEHEVETLQTSIAVDRPTTMRLTQPLGIEAFGGLLMEKEISVEFSSVVMTARRNTIKVGQSVPVKFRATKGGKVSYLVL
ncbi:hypothetical protein [Paraburkholderia terrae]